MKLCNFGNYVGSDNHINIEMDHELLQLIINEAFYPELSHLCRMANEEDKPNFVLMDQMTEILDDIKRLQALVDEAKRNEVQPTAPEVTKCLLSRN